MIVLALAVLVGISRVAVGAHWPADVLAGAFIGWASVLCAGSLCRAWTFGAATHWHAGLCLIVFACAVNLLVVYETGYPEARILEITVACLGILMYFFNMSQRLQSDYATQPRSD